MDKKQKWYVAAFLFGWTAIGAALQIKGVYDMIPFISEGVVVVTLISLALVSGIYVAHGAIEWLLNIIKQKKLAKVKQWKDELIPLEDVAGLMVTLPSDEAITPETTLEILKEAAKANLITIYGVDRAFPSMIHKIKPDFWKDSGVFKVEHYYNRIVITIYRSSYGEEVYSGGKIRKRHHDAFRKFVKSYMASIDQ